METANYVNQMRFVCPKENLNVFLQLMFRVRAKGRVLGSRNAFVTIFISLQVLNMYKRNLYSVCYKQCTNVTVFIPEPR